MTARRPEFSENLASLRGIAALVVVVYHALLIFRVDGHDNPHRLPIDAGDGWLLAVHGLLALFNGAAAVTLFFVLSGTVLTLSLRRTERFEPANLTGFYLKRMFRLYPLLIAATLGAAWMHHVYFTGMVYESTTSWMGRYFQHDPDPNEILKNALGLSNSLNSPAWSIWIEIAGSALFPALCIASRRKVLILPTLAILLALMFVPLPFRYVHTFLISFYLGALVPIYGAPLAARFYRLSGFWRASLTLLLIAIMMIFDRIHSPREHIDPLTVLVESSCAAALIGLTYFAPRLPVLRGPVGRFLGEVSYGIYIFHFTVLFALAHLVAPAQRALEPGTALMLNFGLAAGTLALTVPLAALMHRLIERPFQNLGRRLSRWTLGTASRHGAAHPVPLLPAPRGIPTHQGRRLPDSSSGP